MREEVAFPLIIVVQASSPVNSLKDFIGMARADPARATMASAGNGTRAHFAIELLGGVAGFKVTHVPYVDGSSASFEEFVRGDLKKMENIVRERGIKVDS